MTKAERLMKAQRRREKTRRMKAAVEMLRRTNPGVLKRTKAIIVKKLKGGGITVKPIMNPSRFDKCVASVSARGGAVDPRGVCAAAGRKKYGKKKFAAMGKAGKRRAARRRSR